MTDEADDGGGPDAANRGEHENDTSLTPDRIGEVLETYLMSHGIYVTDCTRDERGLHVGYETLAPGDGVPHQEIGHVLNLLLDLAGIEAEERETDGTLDDAGAWTPEEVHGWVFDESGDQRGHWHVREGWFRALDEDYLSETDFSTLVISTIE